MSAAEKNIDQALVRQVVVNGDKEAFDVLQLKYQSKIKKLVGRFVDDFMDVNDITQETFFKAYRALPRFEGRCAFYTWLYRIAINTTKNYLKKANKEGRRSSITYEDAENAVGHGLFTTETPEDLLIRDEIEDAVFHAMEALPDDLRNALILCDLAGLSYDEISIVMDCPIGTVRSRIHRARADVDEQIAPMLLETDEKPDDEYDDSYNTPIVGR